MLNNDNCPSMVVWGVKDNDSWRSASNPLLYDSGMGRKPAWYAVRSALRHRTLTEAALHPVVNCANSAVYRTGTYDLSGRYVEEGSLHPGLYIQNGKKIYFK